MRGKGHAWNARSFTPYPSPLTPFLSSRRYQPDRGPHGGGIVFRRVMRQDGQRGSRQVPGEMARGLHRISSHAGFQNLPMLVRGNRQGARHFLDVKAAIPVGVVVQLTDGAHHPIAGVRHQGEVELAVGRLPPAEQQAVVRAIVRRETGVMAASALVVALLGLRAAGWL